MESKELYKVKNKDHIKANKHNMHVNICMLKTAEGLLPSEGQKL